FFLGEIYLDLPLPPSPANTGHCGQCQACIEVCPTQAIVGPYRVDARRCISYLTIEHDGAIPVELRPLMGNRIYGCDDCQLVCPWNKFARRSPVPDFDTRAHFSAPGLLQLWSWTEEEFLRRTEGSAIRRIGHRRWRRNLAVAMGNALRQDLASEDREALLAALEAALPQADEVMAEHMRWASSQAAPAPAATPAD
ncbi:MAG TPA: tRNA epoxyqueuosine(34) reductase QueG, partial [Burkholderiaceae bacterium]|nr:tRNA epoxyqueuosine(34) reductase QueG [Burkholderiaceae bacterium]